MEGAPIALRSRWKLGLEVGIGKLWDGCLEVEVGPQFTEALSFQTFDKALGDRENFDTTKKIAKPPNAHKAKTRGGRGSPEVRLGFRKYNSKRRQSAGLNR